MRTFYSIGLFFSFIFLFSCTIYAQEIKISGTIKDQTGKNIEFASIMLVKTSDRYILESCISNLEGIFKITHNKKSKVNLIISHISYQTKILPLPEQCDTTLNIILSPMQYNIEEVKVRGKRVPIQYQNGEWVVNVENFTDQQTERGIDVLKKLPGMFVNEENKQILLNGKNVELQLNGQNYPMGFDLVKAFPAELLDQIVLIPNKRAEHEGSRENAIINIKTKKKFVDGYIGSVEGAYAINRQTKFPGGGNGRFYAMLMKKKFYLNILINPETTSTSARYYDSTYYYKANNYIINQQKLDYKRNWGTQGNLNFNWDIYNGHKLNANLYLLKKHEAPYSHAISRYKTGKQELYDRDQKEKLWMLSGNVNYETSDKLSYKLKLSYGIIDTENDNKYAYLYSLSEDTVNNYNYHYQLDGKQHILKTDFSKQYLNNKLFIGAGLKVNLGKTTNEANYTPVSEYRQNEYFLYKEQIYSGYVSLRYTPTEKINLIAELKAEYTNYKMTLLSVKEIGNNHYWNWLPTLGLNWNAGKNYVAGFYFQTGIIRPVYNMLTPRITWSNSKYYSRGNPYLQPIKSYGLSWTNALFQRFSVTLGWQYFKDQYASVLQIKDRDITENSYQNCFDSWQAYINCVLPVSLVKNRLNIYFIGKGYYGKYLNFSHNFALQSGRNKIVSLDFLINPEFWIGSNYRWKIYSDLNCSLKSKSFQATTKPCFYVNAGIRYKLHKRIPLSGFIYASDIFNSRKSRITYFYDNNVRYYTQHATWQGFTLGLSFDFKGGKDFKRERVTDDVNEPDLRFQK